LDGGTKDVEMALLYAPDGGRRGVMIDDEQGDIARRGDFVGLYQLGDFDPSAFEPVSRPVPVVPVGPARPPRASTPPFGEPRAIDLAGRPVRQYARPIWGGRQHELAAGVYVIHRNTGAWRCRTTVCR
jgi:hypothetical protein